MDGLINLNKPVGITSAKALYRVRSITKVRKSGHAGTLDPAADGVLVLCLGRATKLVEALMDQPKVYRSTARLDVTSATYDAEKELVPVPVDTPPTREAVETAAGHLEGTIEQVPPAFSALKVKGRPAYKLAAEGHDVKLEPRPVQVYWLHVHAYAWPTLDFEMCCGRGTYVRALIRDWGAALGLGGCLMSLTRRAVGRLTVEDAVTFEDLQTKPAESCLMPLEEAKTWLAERPVPVPPKPSIA